MPLCPGDLETLQMFYEARLHGDREHWRLVLVPLHEEMSKLVESIHIEGNVVATMTHTPQGIMTWSLRSGVALAAEIESRCARFQHEQDPGAVGRKPNPAFTRGQIFTRPCLHDSPKTPQHQPK